MLLLEIEGLIYLKLTLIYLNIVWYYLIMVDYIINELEKYSDEKRIKFANTSHPTRMRIIGVTNPNQKLVIKDIKAQIKPYSVKEKMDLIIELINSDVFECQYIAYDIIGNNKAMLKALTPEYIDRMARNLDNWVSVDCYGVYIMGYALRENIVTMDKVKSLLQSNNFWIRRVAVVSTVSLNQKARGGKGDPERTLEICSLVVDDHHDLINKALSWALRELIKIDRDPVISFIDEYHDRLHSRVLREVNNKLETGKKY